MSRVPQLDVFLTIAVALVTGLLGAFDLASPAVVGGATLTTLGLLALGSAQDRLALQALAADVRTLRHQLNEAPRDTQRLG